MDTSFLNTLFSGISNAPAILAAIPFAGYFVKCLTNAVTDRFAMKKGRTPQYVALGVAAFATTAIFLVTQPTFTLSTLGAALLTWASIWWASVGSKETTRSAEELSARRNDGTN